MTSDSTDDERRRVLADFLRSRRAVLTPEMVGLRTSGRRRTPGLRREEVADLADVGLSWYTWLEQGRDISPSAAVLDAVARALRLDPGEREHLLTLAGVAAGARPLDAGAPDEETLAMLAALAPHPAYLLDETFDVVAHNAPAELVMADLLTTSSGRRNLLLWLFADQDDWDPELQDGWSRTAHANVLDFRTAHASHAGEPAFEDLVSQLAATGEPFGRWWADHDVAPLEPTRKIFVHRDLGELRMLQLQSRLTHLPLRLRILVPADDATRVVLSTRFP